MKSKLVSGLGILLVAGIALSPLAAVAEDGQHFGRRGHRIEQFKKQLGITEEQSARMREIREAQKKEMEAVLTPEQREKLQSLKDKRREEWKARKKELCEK